MNRPLIRILTLCAGLSALTLVACSTQQTAPTYSPPPGPTPCEAGGFCPPGQQGKVQPQTHRTPLPQNGPYPILQAEQIYAEIQRCKSHKLYSNIYMDTGQVRDISCFPPGYMIDLVTTRNGDVYYRENGSYLPENPTIKPPQDPEIPVPTKININVRELRVMPKEVVEK